MVNIFGLWLVLAHITYLEPSHFGCYVHFDSDVYGKDLIEDHKCDEVAMEINKAFKL